jgi:hypothetical protein
VTVAGWDGVHLLTHPVEGLVVTTSLIDAATMPVGRAGTTVVSVIITLRSTWAVTSPRICTGRSKADTEQPGNSDSRCERRCGQRTFEKHFLTPFLVTRHSPPRDTTL